MTDLAGDLLLEPGGLLPQRLHERNAGARAAEVGTRRRDRSRGGRRGPGSGGLRPLPCGKLVRPLLDCFARPTLSGAFAVLGRPHGPFSSSQPGRPLRGNRVGVLARSVASGVGSCCQAGPTGRFVVVAVRAAGGRGRRMSPCVSLMRSRGRGRLHPTAYRYPVGARTYSTDITPAPFNSVLCVQYRFFFSLRGFMQCRCLWD